MSGPRRPGPVAREDLDLPGGIRLRVARYTPRGSPGPPVVLVHGFRGDHHGLDTIALFLTRRRRAETAGASGPGQDAGAGGLERIVAPDLPGFGAGPPLPGRHDLAAYVRVLADLLAAEGATPDRPVVLVGHSFGSVLVAHLAAARPELVAGLALVNPITSDPLAGPRAWASRATRGYYGLARGLARLAGPGPARAFLAWPPVVRAMSEAMATTRDPALRAWIHDQHARHFSTFSDARVVAEAFEVSITHTVRDVEAVLAAAPFPVLVVAGDADDIAPLPGQRAFAAAVGARLVVLPRVGHLVHYERPDAAADAVADLLADLAARRADAGRPGSEPDPDPDPDHAPAPGPGPGPGPGPELDSRPGPGPDSGSGSGSGSTRTVAR
ncbi:alpha/beta fold hydrolase [Agilicoccus flavus]|uniref:alpha/beta fold hydrolase n=1 Tax=Agilicoccus flavus TaxID=2775968 RepID=UPI0027DAA0FE|nr:alpha/beta hydrolase [Agilicoccus flavus]